MSLINDMLRDLEKRQAPDRSQQAPAQNYGALTQRETPRSNRLLMILLALTLLTFIGLVLGWWYLQAYQTSSLGEGPINSSQAPSQNVQAAVPPIESKPEGKVQRVSEPSIESRTSTPVVSEAPAAKRQSKPVETRSVALVALPVPAKSARSQPTVVQKSRAVTTTQKAVAKKESTKKAQTTLKATPIMTEQSEPKASLAGASRITKTHVLSPEQQDHKMADIGSGMLQRGEKKAARDTLYSFIRTHKVAEQSRIVLIRDLMHSGELAEAGNVLASSDVQSNSYLRRLKAHLLAQNGQPDQAVVLLNSNLPDVDEDTDYHVLLAALYQQQGYNKEAAASYAELLGFNQDIADWWVGMGISLDRSGQYKAAKRAYDQALKMNGLRPELADFARQRVGVLGE